MPLTKEDISIQGTGGYGTLSYTPEPGENIEGTAGDIAAETATSGIVSSDASAELAGQAPNIVVPVNQSSDSVDRNINFETGDITGSTSGDINIYDEAALTGGITNTGSVTNLKDISNLIQNPTDKPLVNFGLRAGLASVFPFLAPFFAANTAYQYAQDRAEEKKELERQAQLGLQSSLDDTDPADVGFTQSGTFGGNPTYSDDGSTVDTEGNITKADGTYGGNIVDEFGESGDVYSTPTNTAPAVDYGYDANYGYQDSGSDSGQSDSQAGADAAQDDESAGYGGYAVGGIVRLRKNKQNSRIHDRRKRLAMGGIVSLHG
jgi:hypothetical protein